MGFSGGHRLANGLQQHGPVPDQAVRARATRLANRSFHATLASFCRAFLTFARTIHADHVAVAYRIVRHGYGTSHEPSRGIDGSQPLAVGFRERLGGNTLPWLQQAGDGQACQRTLAMGTA